MFWRSFGWEMYRFAHPFQLAMLAYNLNCWLALAAPIAASPGRHCSQRQIRERIAL
jgi:hypothetical protein